MPALHPVSRRTALPALLFLLLLLSACQSNPSGTTTQPQGTTLQSYPAHPSSGSNPGTATKSGSGTTPGGKNNPPGSKNNGSGTTPTPSAGGNTPQPSTPSPTSGTSISTGETAAEAQVTQQLFTLINSDRASNGRSAYSWNSILANGARQHTLKMIQCGLNHACPGEPDPCQREINEGINYMACGENIGYSSPRPDAFGGAQWIEQSMLAEQPPNNGHRLNLLSSAFHQLGVGIVIDSQGLVWITEDFAN